MLRDTFTVKTDESLEQFTNAFIELQDRFRRRLNLEGWKVARAIQDGVVRLVAGTDRLTEIGELQYAYNTFL